VLAAVKAWPAKHEYRRTRGATAILDSGCARRHVARTGRDEETVLRSNQETDLTEADNSRATKTGHVEKLLTVCGLRYPAAATPWSLQNW
jgi:hypothetical protein